MSASDIRGSFPILLSLNAGYVDTAGFLALQGLFTAHVTGNFVTLGASIALGTTGAVAKVLALPVFCIVVIASRLLGSVLSGRRGAAPGDASRPDGPAVGHGCNSRHKPRPFQ
jgi:uncharacterized membrane protein YoaK (UPF0700 family)